MSDPTITFVSGAGLVAGAEFLYETDGYRFLVDCGLIQGTHEQQLKNYEPITMYDPATVDAVFVTHAHIDHIGRLPKLVAAGFQGRIISTEPTRRIAEVMLYDELGLMEDQAQRDGMQPLFTEHDITTTMHHWQSYPLHGEIKLTDTLGVTLYDAGHILGSSLIYVNDNGLKTLFTGDLGNSPSPILPDTEIPPSPDYLVTESVYGDRNHEARDERALRLEQVYMDNIQRGGVLVIPAFSVERTQELLLELDHLVESGAVPRVPVFVDSPLGIAVTDIYRTSREFLQPEIQKEMETDNPFSFPGLTFTRTSDESKRILDVPAPKVVIASSGMSSGGRILHHEKNYLGDPNNTLLFVGYQAPGTLGRKIFEGARQVRIYGDTVTVRARIEVITGYSGHKDMDHLQEFVHVLSANLKRVYVVLGEGGSSRHMAQELRGTYGIDAVVPEHHEKVVLKR